MQAWLVVIGIALVLACVSAQTPSDAPGGSGSTTFRPTDTPSTSSGSSTYRPTDQPPPTTAQPHDDSTTFSLPYCASAYAPYCPSGCNYYRGNTPCGAGTCGDVTLDYVVNSTTYGTKRCLQITGDYQVDIFCRIKPTTGELCLTTNGQQGEACYRPRQFIDYTYYMYSNSAMAQPYILLLLAGTCNSPTGESDMERAATYPLCSGSALTQPTKGNTKTVTISQYSCTLVNSQTSCSGDVSKTYTLEQGKKLHTEILYDKAVGMLLTGDQVCFSWLEKISTLYDNLSPSYDDKCHEECINVGKSTSLTAQYSMTYSSYSTPTASQYKWVVNDGGKGGEGISNAASLSPSLLFAAVCMCFYALVNM